MRLCDYAVKTARGFVEIDDNVEVLEIGRRAYEAREQERHTPRHAIQDRYMEALLRRLKAPK